MTHEGAPGDVAGIKEAINASIKAHPGEAPSHFAIDDPKKVAAAQAAVLALSYETGQVIVLLYPDTAEPGAMGKT